MQAKPSNITIEFFFHVSGEHPSVTMLEKEHDNSSSISGSSPSASKEILDSPSFSFEGRSVPIISGRPNLKSILSEWISTCGQSISVNGEIILR